MQYSTAATIRLGGKWHIPAWFLVLTVLSTAVGCKKTGPDYPGPQTGGSFAEGGSGGSGGDPGAPCDDGSQRECKVELGEQGGVKSCFVGVETCIDGEWGPCLEPSDEGAGGAPAAHKTRFLRDQVLYELAPAQACGNNPCDPTCKVFDEQPNQAILPDKDVSPYQWLIGSAEDLPTALQDKGSVEPCSMGADCQFNQYCSNPTSGVCTHSKCQVGLGAGLSPTCDPCVDAICQVQPSCCRTHVGPNCEHDLCQVGGPVKSTCDPCATSICSDPAFAYCCSIVGPWDAACAARVPVVCGKTCQAGSWTQACVNAVSSVCNAYCPPENCGESCPTEGQCHVWTPGATNPKCTGVDLAAGIACSSNGQTVLPICNHGTAAAPAGIAIGILPAGQIPAQDPDLACASWCYTSVPIPPGECVNVSSCGQLSDAHEIVVNPPNKPGAVAECHSDDNWTIPPASPKTCAAPACAGSSTAAATKRLNLFFSVDRSGSMLTKSMNLPGTPTRWQQLAGAIKAFAQDPDSAGLGVWVRFWPYSANSPCPQPFPAGCDASGCRIPNVPLGNLTAESGSADSQEMAVISGIDAAVPTNGSTPMYPALAGALAAANTYQLQHPDELTAVVLVTDGQPTQCDTVPSHLAALASSAYLSAGVRTYAIGIADVEEATIASIASAGGGKHFFVDPSDATPVEVQVLTALLDIRSTGVACAFDLPSQATFDDELMTVEFTSGSGSTHPIDRVDTVADCGAGGWYYDDNLNPSRLTLCAETCTAVQENQGSLTFFAPCPNKYDKLVMEEVYEGKCGPGTTPQWGFLAYEATAPSNSSLTFAIQAGFSPTFQQGSGTIVAVAKGSDGSTLCGMGGPSPCPIDLTGILGEPDNHAPYLHLEVSFDPSGDSNHAPSLEEWQVTYSCPDSE
ncbi:MAG: VWA domain-containing protein [Polyangiaceae bacterium]|nr:VWA domain-containing protein [Polyangiaceae bacterium]